MGWICMKGKQLATRSFGYEAMEISTVVVSSKDEDQGNVSLMIGKANPPRSPQLLLC